MKLEPILEELEGAAQKLAVSVRYEPLSTSIGHGGLCKVKGEYRVIIDRRATTAERVAALARSLSQLDTSGVFLSPAARDTIERYRG
ncbi:MAG: hypothetical protein D6689_00955 [Deltaproteobacteria bacterium]|nr:MAG: hypothetical protein D6689_00955 [Deltaproteobacteria bacterium]